MTTQQAAVTDFNWQEMADTIAMPNHAIINGDNVSARSGRTQPVVNPATAESLTEVADCGPEDADIAVKVARDTFESGVWSAMAPGDRKRVLLRWADLIEKNHAEIALLESLSAGKPISDCFYVDVPSCLNTLRWTAEATDKVYDEIAPTAADTLALVKRLPLGVIAAIVPWNFPLSTTAWKLAPALATGNSVILKPDPKTPFTALKIAELAHQAGLPAGVLQVLPGDGISLGKHLSLHPDIDGQTFTGSTGVGKLLMQYSGQSNLKRTFLELGGKSANIVFADANLEKAADAAVLAGFFNSGQTCTAGTRLLIQDEIYDAFLAMVLERAKNWCPDNPLNPSTNMGPVVDQRQLDTIQGYVQKGLDEGAKLVYGGKVMEHPLGGFFHEPTIFAEVDNSMTIAQEEIFGPVMSVIRFKDAADAIRIANDSPYGLAGAVWSLNINTAHKVAAAVRTGTMGINNYFGGDITVPFGGFKESGNGRDKSLHAMDDYTELKTTWIEFE
ncbi:aldehyde dehydrogenase [Oceanospirillum linum]|uniref:Aldehyde dehydrogenase PuuC n=1 Tax=Oceanospirillum linum TaxID=966 RepID=A0A1T1HDC6_OCELI|nr:aldehyde dehydrogenase [Oceanospirillum linum]OOV87858.1 aldehyde dehydrogenase PuuC [Oceanospirillum linum]SEG09973.1 gamma-glutamyl-gamma-aminobutyraldehyde dehydrogenase [Oleiphilus messinensis]SMP08756.1 gamma-glutamyl-gamma-aminobutyraldehyde dehydrogenase [Oceanospirillum linum]